jgi:hypothetical protein
VVRLEKIPPVVELNNRPVALMKEAKYESAVPTLSKSLSIMKKYFSSFQGFSDDHILPACPSSDHITYRYINLQTEKYPSSRGHSYRCPVEITGVRYCSTPRDCRKFPSIIIFNLALAYHCLAMDSSNVAAQYINLRKALQLYEVAHESHSKEERRENMLDIIIIVNNIAKIYKEVRNECSARQCE